MTFVLILNAKVKIELILHRGGLKLRGQDLKTQGKNSSKEVKKHGIRFLSQQ